MGSKYRCQRSTTNTCTGNETGTGPGKKRTNATVLSGSECVRRPVEDAALWNLQLECLRKAVDTLGTQDQDLIELRYGRSLTMEEIGINYGVSTAAVSKRLKKFHEQLRGSVL